MLLFNYTARTLRLSIDHRILCWAFIVDSFFTSEVVIFHPVICIVGLALHHGATFGGCSGFGTGYRRVRVARGHIETGV